MLLLRLCKIKKKAESMFFKDSTANTLKHVPLVHKRNMRKWMVTVKKKQLQKQTSSLQSCAQFPHFSPHPSSWIQHSTFIYSFLDVSATPLVAVIYSETTEETITFPPERGAYFLWYPGNCICHFSENWCVSKINIHCGNSSSFRLNNQLSRVCQRPESVELRADLRQKRKQENKERRVTALAKQLLSTGGGN